MDLGPIIQMDETVIDNFDLDKSARILANVNGIPEDIKRDEEAVKNIREGRSQAIEEEKQKELLLEIDKDLVYQGYLFSKPVPCEVFTQKFLK